MGYNYGQVKEMMNSAQARKNWKAISECRNEQLRHSLIAAQGEIAEGLAAGFPQFFLVEGEDAPCPSREEFFRVISEMTRRDDTLQACKEAGLPHQRFSFEGSCSGSTPGVPKPGPKPTSSKAPDNRFIRSSSYRGDEVEYEGVRWIVVWNGYSPGSPSAFASTSFVIVPAGAFAAAAETKKVWVYWRLGQNPRVVWEVLTSLQNAIGCYCTTIDLAERQIEVVELTSFAPELVRRITPLYQHYDAVVADSVAVAVATAYKDSSITGQILADVIVGKGIIVPTEGGGEYKAN